MRVCGNYAIGRAARAARFVLEKVDADVRDA
jgi:hypothetical protein